MSSREFQVSAAHDITVLGTQGTLRGAGETRKGKKNIAKRNKKYGKK